MLSGWGIPLIEINQSVLVLGFKDPTNHSMSFSEDIDPILQTFHVMFSGSAHFPPKNEVVEFNYFDISRNSRFRKWFGDFLDLLKVLGVPKIKNNWFGESWSRPPGPETITIDFSSLPIMNPKTY